MGCALLLAFTACKKTTSDNTFEAPAPAVLAASDIDAYIRQQIQARGEFNWNEAPENIVWSALQQSDHVISVGYMPAGETNVDARMGSIDIQQPSWKQARRALLEQIVALEKQVHPTLTLDNVELWEETVLPVVDVRIDRIETLRMLRSSSLVRYAEPIGYEPKQQSAVQSVLSSSGCGSNVAEPGLVAGSDFITIAPNTKQSWNYSFHGIPTAWTRSTGAGIKVFIIDTGSEFDQENLGSAFNQGSSSGRTIERIVTLPRNTFLGIPTGSVETADDACGHGTSMAGACAAPRGTDGAAVGVAYNANLVTCRAAADVLIDESRETKGVSDAFVNAGNRTDVRIISMSMGRITSSSQIRDAVRYAHSRGKLIFTAAGTSFGLTSGWWGVIFPATMPEVNAVTGVRDNNFNTQCTACHDGSETDFTVVMERGSNTDRHPLTLAMRGDAPSTVGGSSVATATTAGMAALVWSRFPTMTRDQVLNKLILSSSNYPTKSSRLGWGNINAALATQ